MSVAVDCPICGADTILGKPTVAPGYDLPPAGIDIGGRVIMATEHVSPRVTSFPLDCGCIVPYPGWILVFPTPQARPFFKRDEEYLT